MEKNDDIDNFGQRIHVNSMILCDPSLGKRIKAFDPNLDLYFDCELKRWVVREWAPDNSGWNKIIVAEDKEGNPEPLGDWIFQALRIKRDAWERKMAMGVNDWFKSMTDKAKEQKEKMAQKASRDNIDMIKDDILQWRKATRTIGSPSDVTAGYRKYRK